MTTTEKMVPECGTLSHGTMVPEDLAAAFMPAVRAFCARETYLDCAALWLDAERDCDGEAKTDAVTAMFAALDDAAPEGMYFGSLEGDASDYGFWFLEDDGQ